MTLTAVQLIGGQWSESDNFGRYVAALYSPSTPSWGRKLIGSVNANGYTLIGGTARAEDITTDFNIISESFEGKADEVITDWKNLIGSPITPAKARELSGLDFKVKSDYEELFMTFDKTIAGVINPGWIIDELNTSQPNVCTINNNLASYQDETWLGTDVSMVNGTPSMVNVINNFLGYSFIGSGEPIAMPVSTGQKPTVIVYL